MSAYIINVSTWLLVGIGIYAFLAVLRDALSRPKHRDPNYLTASDPRCEALRIKQEKAAQFMRRNGIKTLLEGKPGWRRLVDMGEAPKADKVTHLRGRR